MRTFYFGFFGVFALTYLAYLTWLTGYRAGYEQGATKAWDNARKALAPELVRTTDLGSRTSSSIISTGEPIAVTESE